MANLNELEAKVNALTLVVNSIIANAKRTNDLVDASTPLLGSEFIRLVQGGVSVKTTADELKGPTTGEANVNADWNELNPASDAYIIGKPNIATKWIEIDDALVYKGVNTGGTIQVGDIIMRHPTASRFIHAKVNALPYTDDANLTFFQDIILM